MGDNVFKNPKCCDSSCECPVCFENKLLMGLNCGHYFCPDCIKIIIQLSILSAEDPLCPLCKVPITSYGCNGQNTAVTNELDSVPNIHSKPRPNRLTPAFYSRFLPSNSSVLPTGGKLKRTRKNKSRKNKSRKNKSRKNKSRKNKSRKRI
jgi:hypothetical protein